MGTTAEEPAADAVGKSDIGGLLIVVFSFLCRAHSISSQHEKMYAKALEMLVMCC
jgi:hypothetical protein